MRAALACWAAASLLAGCVGVIRHARCQGDFDACSQACAAPCEGREAGPRWDRQDPYLEEEPDVGGDLELVCAECVGDCSKRAEACDQAEDARFTGRPLAEHRPGSSPPAAGVSEGTPGGP